MREIQVLGPGCATCEKLAANAEVHGVDLESAVAERFFGGDERRTWATAGAGEP